MIQKLYVTRRKTKELKELLIACEKLVRLNMSQFYDLNQWENTYSDKIGYCSTSKLKELEQPGILYLAEKDGGGMTGFLKLDLTDDAFVMELQVQPEAQSRGIGSQLLKSAMADTKAAGYPVLNLCVQRGNDRALDFYISKMGFRMSNQCPTYYILSHDIH